jgi:hypothetical protein
MATFQSAVLYAWHGSGRRWDTVWIGILGGLLGGLVFWAVGLKVPQAILDNPGWGAVAGIMLGAITGVMFVFLVRLCWAPFHFRLEPLGGFRKAVHGRLGVQMWPALLVISGIVSFVLLSGVGLLLFLTNQAPKTASIATASCKAGNTAYNISRKLQAIDDLYAELSGPVSNLQNKGGSLLNTFNSRIQQSTAIPDLDGYAAEARDTFNKFSAKVESYMIFIDVYNIIIHSNFAYSSSESASINLRSILENLYRSTPHDMVPGLILSSSAYDHWRTSIMQTATWIGQMQNDLRIKRREYEAIDICG